MKTLILLAALFAATTALHAATPLPPVPTQAAPQDTSDITPVPSCSEVTRLPALEPSCAGTFEPSCACESTTDKRKHPVIHFVAMEAARPIVGVEALVVKATGTRLERKEAVIAKKQCELACKLESLSVEKSCDGTTTASSRKTEKLAKQAKSLDRAKAHLAKEQCAQVERVTKLNKHRAALNGSGCEKN